MRFLLLANHGEADIKRHLGTADYSYWFVLRYFEKFLSSIGETVVLFAIEDVPECLEKNEEMLLLFMPPHKIPPQISKLGIPVFAWEYDTLPSEEWGGNEQNNWVNLFHGLPGIITHSKFVADQIKEAIGPDLPVAVIRTPVWDEFVHDNVHYKEEEWSLIFHGLVIDTSFDTNTDREIDYLCAEGGKQYDLNFSGIIYTSVFNPNDSRKKWADTISAFILAHGANSNATLILKLILAEGLAGAEDVWQTVINLAPFHCRILILKGFLEIESYKKLIRGTTFIVNNAVGEGQCLPLVEFMSAGVPAIAPSHTAMQDYVFKSNAIVLAHSKVWTSWPHDSRLLYKCFSFPVIWESLRDAFLESYEIATLYSTKYESMSVNARSTLESVYSARVAKEAFVDFVAKIQNS